MVQISVKVKQSDSPKCNVRLTILTFSISRYFYVYSLGNWGVVGSVWFGFSFELMLDCAPQVFHTASIWLTLALALQRWIFVCKPELAKVWCTVENTKRGIVAIFCLSFLHQITR